MNSIHDYTKSVILARRDGDFETEEEYAEYDRRKRLRNKSPNARCCNINCNQYKQCRGICKKAQEPVSKLEHCPLNKW